MGGASSIQKINPDDVPARIAPNNARELLPDIYTDDLFRSVIYNEGVIPKDEFLQAIETAKKKHEIALAAAAAAEVAHAKAEGAEGDDKKTWDLIGQLEQCGGDRYALKREAHKVDTSMLGVRVESSEGKPIPYAKVFVSGKREAATDESGLCIIPRPKGANEDGSAQVVTISAQKLGWSNATIVSQAPHTSSMTITMIRAGSCRRLDMNKGGVVKDAATGTQITVAANSLQYPNGKAFAGNAAISFTVIDATKPDQLAAMPGDLVVPDGENGPKGITSFGAVWIEAADEKDAPLMLAPKAEPINLELMSAVAVDAAKLQQPPSLWQWNEKEGVWQQDEVPLNTAGKSIAYSEESKTKAVAPPAKKKGKKGGKKKKKGGGDDPADNFWTLENYAKVFEESEEGKPIYQGKVKALGWWNIDAPYNSVMLTGTIDPKGAMVAGRVLVQSQGMSYSGRATVAADEQMKFNVLAQIDSDVKLEVRFGIQTGEGFGNQATVQKLVTFGPFKSPPAPGAIVDLGKLDLPAE